MNFLNEKRTDRVEVRIEPTLKELLDETAREHNMNSSEFVRTLIIKEVKKWQKKHNYK